MTGAAANASSRSGASTGSARSQPSSSRTALDARRRNSSGWASQAKLPRSSSGCVSRARDGSGGRASHPGRRRFSALIRSYEAVSCDPRRSPDLAARISRSNTLLLVEAGPVTRSRSAPASALRSATAVVGRWRTSAAASSESVAVTPANPRDAAQEVVDDRRRPRGRAPVQRRVHGRREHHDGVEAATERDLVGQQGPRQLALRRRDANERVVGRDGGEAEPREVLQRRPHMPRLEAARRTRPRATPP